MRELWSVTEGYRRQMGGIRNFQVCARCRNHGIKVMLKGHKKICPHKLCDCSKCLVTKDRQSFIAKEIAMHRYEIKSKSDSDCNLQGIKLSLVRSKSMDEKSSLSNEFSYTRTRRSSKYHSTSGEIRKDQLCSRCRNHGVTQLLRGHKGACVFADCMCEKCEITIRRREIMAKQIKDYRTSKNTEGSSSFKSSEKSPELLPDFEKLCVATTNSFSEPFVPYQPVTDRDLFFMVQSLFEKCCIQNNEKRIQITYALAHLARGNWDVIEKALEEGENKCLTEKIGNVLLSK